MTFTDDDLKRLKEIIQARGFDWEIYNVRALLARLETAERVCERVELSQNTGEAFIYEGLIVAWREAAGK